jgi:Dyp-type peroxidase family
MGEDIHMRQAYTATQMGGVANLALMARVKPGVVEGFETFTFDRRLDLLFTTVNAGRLASRESLRVPSPFQDSVGRWGIIQSFRYAVFGPDDDPDRPPGEPAVHRVYLNVGFDGGWEPYLRVIYRDLGSLLDAIFCNCVGYPLARRNGYEAYERWVRAHEVDGGIYYTESSMSVGDQRYLRQLERIQREQRDPVTADRQIAGLSLPDATTRARDSLHRALSDPAHALDLAFRSLRSLYALRPLYPANAAGDDAVLLRFAQDALVDFRGLIRQGLFDHLLRDLAGEPAQQLAQALQAAHRDELAWLGTPAPVVPSPYAEARWDLAQVQAGIIERLPAQTHGALVLMHVTDARRAARTLARGPWSNAAGQAVAGADTIWRNVALTWPGLQALGLPAELLARFPQEFVDGMEARAGLLGDVRGNHPEQWQRPLHNRGTGATPALPLALSAVHVLVQLRLADPADGRHDLHPRLDEVIRSEFGADCGLQVLAVEPMRSWPDAQGVARGHFGYADGLSQPQPVADKAPAAAWAWSDEVLRGEVLLGFRSDRDPVAPEPDRFGFMPQGSFLVVRQLRQHVDRLQRVIDEQVESLEPVPAKRLDLKESLLAQMMGRGRDGVALVPVADPAQPNLFDFRSDPLGQHCPFHSHVRRANPRTAPEPSPPGEPPRPASPRIMRRGMSYGPPVDPDHPERDDRDRGLFFMAYMGSLAEQFEVVQRWMAGGNASGALSTPGDPFLGVPVAGEQRIYRWLQPDQQVRRLDLGSEPLVSLRWGLYAFAPSLAALRRLPTLVAAAKAAARGVPARAIGKTIGQSTAPAAGDHAAWKAALEDTRPHSHDRQAAWTQVRQAGGVLDTAYGRLHGSAAAVTKAFADDGRVMSVCGYGHRMATSLGVGYLGQDTAGADITSAPLARTVNRILEGVTLDQAFRATRPLVRKALQALLDRTRLTTPQGETPNVPVNLAELSETVLAGLCSRWFGLPDDGQAVMQSGGRVDAPDVPVRCPGHFVSVSRWVFSPEPSSAVEAAGTTQGAAIRAALRAWIESGPRTTTGTEDLSRPILDAVRRHSGRRARAEEVNDLAARTLGGALLGFAPTVHGNVVEVLRGWIDSRAWWDLQLQWLPAATAGAAGDEQADVAKQQLLQPLLAQMARQPTPSMLWRLPPAARDDPAGCPASERQVIGIGSALQEPGADKMLMFGGRRRGKNRGVHACPGYTMGMGVMLGLLSSLLEAGEWRATASATALTWRPRD